MKLTDPEIIEAIKSGVELVRGSNLSCFYHIREGRTGLEAYVRFSDFRHTNFVQKITLAWLNKNRKGWERE